MCTGELDVDDVDGKPNCADEETPPTSELVHVYDEDRFPGEIIACINDGIQTCDARVACTGIDQMLQTTFITTVTMC